MSRGIDLNHEAFLYDHPLHRSDLPDLSRYKNSVAIDTETMGLHPHRDRLCVVQMSNGDGTAGVIQVPKDIPTLTWKSAARQS